MKTVVATVNPLPVELWARIFLFAIGLDAAAIWRIALVCCTWKKVVYSTPKLWSYVYFHIREHLNPRKIHRPLCRYIENSGSQLLDVDLSRSLYADFSTLASDDEEVWSDGEEGTDMQGVKVRSRNKYCTAWASIFKTVVEKAGGRLRRLLCDNMTHESYVYMPKSFYGRISQLEELSLTARPRESLLHCECVECHIDANTDELCLDATPENGYVSKLRNLSLYEFGLHMLYPSPSLASLDLEQRCAVNLRSSMRVLGAHPALERLSLISSHCVGLPTEIILSESELDSIPRINLPSLRFLSLHGGAATNIMLGRLGVPALSELCVTFNARHEFICLAPFIASLSKLVSLSITFDHDSRLSYRAVGGDLDDEEDFDYTSGNDFDWSFFVGLDMVTELTVKEPCLSHFIYAFVQWPGMSLRRLNLSSSVPAFTDLVNLINALGEKPALEHLTLHIGAHYDIQAQPLPSQLARLPSLRSLSLIDCHTVAVTNQLFTAPNLSCLHYEGGDSSDLAAFLKIHTIRTLSIRGEIFDWVFLQEPITNLLHLEINVHLLHSFFSSLHIRDGHSPVSNLHSLTVNTFQFDYIDLLDLLYLVSERGRPSDGGEYVGKIPMPRLFKEDNARKRLEIKPHPDYEGAKSYQLSPKGTVGKVLEKLEVILHGIYLDDNTQNFLYSRISECTISQGC